MSHTFYRSNDFSIFCFCPFKSFCFSYRLFRSLHSSFMRSNCARTPSRQEKVSDLERLELHLGKEQVQLIVERSKALEQAERANYPLIFPGQIADCIIVFLYLLRNTYPVYQILHFLVRFVKVCICHGLSGGSAGAVGAHERTVQRAE